MAAVNPFIFVPSGGTGSTVNINLTGGSNCPFFSDTYANLKANDSALPCLGYATDLNQLFFNTTILTVGDQGWILIGG